MTGLLYIVAQNARPFTLISPGDRMVLCPIMSRETSGAPGPSSDGIRKVHLGRPIRNRGTGRFHLYLVRVPCAICCRDTDCILPYPWGLVADWRSMRVTKNIINALRMWQAFGQDVESDLAAPKMTCPDIVFSKLLMRQCQIPGSHSVVPSFAILH